MRKFGIDISRWQGDFDVQKAVNESGVQFAILKIGGNEGGTYKDSKFEANYTKCVNANLDKGAYFFGGAKTETEAENEAKYLLTLLAGHKFEYPIFYDVEGDMLKLDKLSLTKVIKRFCETIEKNGYWVGIYSSTWYFDNAMNDNELSRYSHWVASWSVTEPPVLKKGGATQMWQFGGEKNATRSPKINGQTVDQNYCYVDYPTKIKSKGLNGYTKNSGTTTNKTTTKKKTNQEIANEIYHGTCSDSRWTTWGNEPDRSKRLTMAGYDPKAIQALVNKMFQ